jgi:hypothetical protein
MLKSLVNITLEELDDEGGRANVAEEDEEEEAVGASEAANMGATELTSSCAERTMQQRAACRAHARSISWSTPLCAALSRFKFASRSMLYVG